jgi:Peptidase family C25
LLLACSAAEVDDARDCLAEELVRRQGGPVAVIGGTRVTMPYGMAALSLELASQYFDRKAGTLGEVLHNAKREMLLSGRTTTGRMALDLAASAFSPSPADLPQQRLEHAHLMELVGDPLLAIRHPLEVQLTAPPSATPGDELVVDGQCKIDGRYRVELVVPLGRKDAVETSPPAGSVSGESPQLVAYRTANDGVYEVHQGDAVDGKFRAVFNIPQAAHGSYIVRAYIEAAAGFAMGAAAVQVVGVAAP